jgi:hypothetical protein
LEALAVGKVAVEVTGAALVAQVEIMVGGDKEVVDLDSDPVVGALEEADLVVADPVVGALEVVEDLAAAVEIEVVAASLL